MLRYWVGIWLFSAFFGMPCLAQNPFYTPANKWEVSMFVGLSSLGDDTFATPIEGGGTRVVGLNGESSYLAGARITENLGQYFGAELEYARANQPMSFVNLSSTLPQVDVDQKVHKLAYSVLIYGRDRQQRLRPFVSLGVGASFYEVSADMEELVLAQGVDLKNRWKFAFSYGAGIKYSLKDQWGLRFGFRDHVTGVPDFGLPPRGGLVPGPEPGPGFRPEGSFHNWQATVGFVYSFGSE